MLRLLLHCRDSTVDPHLSGPDGIKPRPDMWNGRMYKTVQFQWQFYLMHSKKN